MLSLGLRVCVCAHVCLLQWLLRKDRELSDDEVQEQLAPVMESVLGDTLGGFATDGVMALMGLCGHACVTNVTMRAHALSARCICMHARISENGGWGMGCFLGTAQRKALMCSLVQH